MKTEIVFHLLALRVCIIIVIYKTSPPPSSTHFFVHFCYFSVFSIFHEHHMHYYKMTCVLLLTACFCFHFYSRRLPSVVNTRIRSVHIGGMLLGGDNYKKIYNSKKSKPYLYTHHNKLQLICSLIYVETASKFSFLEQITAELNSKFSYCYSRIAEDFVFFRCSVLRKRLTRGLLL